jgi:hypothetical protein
MDDAECRTYLQSDDQSIQDEALYSWPAGEFRRQPL